jgi:Chaperone of endosialidase/Stigma-specific protein, Stig1
MANRSRRWAGVAALAVFFFFAACGSVTPVGDGGAGTSGAAGATGSAGAGAAGASGHGGGGASGHGGGGATGAAGATGSAGTGGVCLAACTVGRTCCGGGCVNTENDPMNCGACGKRCEGETTFCNGGTCVAPPCGPTVRCTSQSSCCGNACCAPGDLCCDRQGPISDGQPICFTPTADQRTCPQGCAPLCISDRNAKKNISPADTASVLDEIRRLPISIWTYRSEPDTIRHLGPMAQDFRARFGLGDDDRTYFAIDAQGVALAAIQALDHVVSEQRQRLEQLERRNEELARELRAISAKTPARRAQDKR